MWCLHRLADSSQSSQYQEDPCRLSLNDIGPPLCEDSPCRPEALLGLSPWVSGSFANGRSSTRSTQSVKHPCVSSLALLRAPSFPNLSLLRGASTISRAPRLNLFKLISQKCIFEHFPNRKFPWTMFIISLIIFSAQWFTSFKDESLSLQNRESKAGHSFSLFIFKQAY